MADPVTGHAGDSSEGSESRTRHARARADMWRAVSDLAIAWAGTPVIRRLAAELPRNAAQRVNGIPRRLQEMEAGGAGVSHRPLRLTRTVQIMSRMPRSPLMHEPPDPQKWNEWLSAAATTEATHKVMIAWLRARMPRYPILPAPQLAPESPLRIDESGYELRWERSEPLPGLQFANPDFRIGQLLHAPASQQQRIADGTRILGTTLESTEEWQLMDSAAASMTAESRAELRMARSTLSDRLSPAEVTRHSHRAHERWTYRRAVMAEVLASLSGPAAAYAGAFDAANKLLETVAGDTFSQLAVYGPPETEVRPANIDILPGHRGPQVSFTRAPYDGNGLRPHLQMGEIVWLDDALVRDCVQIVAVEFSSGLYSDGEDRERVTGVMLEGTCEGWRR